MFCQVSCIRGQVEFCRIVWRCANAATHAKFVDRQAHTRANVQKAPGHGHILEMKNSAYHYPYDLIDNEVNAIYIVYKLRDYDSTCTVHNYLFSCGMYDNHRGVCCLKDEKTMRVYGVAGHPYNYMGISNFPISYFNPCRRDKRCLRIV